MTRLLLFFASLGACSTPGTDASSGAPPNTEPQSLQGCLADYVRTLDAPVLTGASTYATCAAPYLTAPCAAAWEVVRRTHRDEDLFAAISTCTPALCSGLPAPRPALCDDSSPPSFMTTLLWQQLHRTVLERDLGHERGMALLGFLAGLTMPTSPSHEPP